MSDEDWQGGWSICGKALHVGRLPGRKQHALYILERGTIRPLAYFSSDVKAREAMDMLTKIANAKNVIP